MINIERLTRLTSFTSKIILADRYVRGAPTPLVSAMTSELRAGTAGGTSLSLWNLTNYLNGFQKIGVS